MYAYVVRRLVAGAILLIVMSLVTFVLFFSAGEPARFACGKNCTEERLQITKQALGYDKPVLVQWGDFLKGVVEGRDYPDDPAIKAAHPETVAHCPAPCLGHSNLSNANVRDLLGEALPVSASLALMAFVLWITGGILFGVTAALRKGTVIDRGIVGLSLIFYAFPTFFVGLFLLKFLAIKWELVTYPSYVSPADGIWPWLEGLLLPGLTLALFFMAGYVRMTRAFVIESLSEDYVRTARAKGLKPRQVTYKHALRAALTPLVTMAGLDVAGVVGGAIITETVFNYQGLGKLAVTSTVERDLPITLGIVLTFAVVVILANIIVDILYAALDPRVRLA